MGGGSGKIEVDFRNQVWPSKNLKLTKGLFVPPETWGSWSIDKAIILGFTRALPETFTLTLQAKAFGPNIGKPIEIIMGDHTQSFVVGSQFESVDVHVKNPQRVNELKFIIPRPTSPAELHLGNDERKLGIAISALAITW